jgi:hypothetical protein
MRYFDAVVNEVALLRLSKPPPEVCACLKAPIGCLSSHRVDVGIITTSVMQATDTPVSTKTRHHDT